MYPYLYEAMVQVLRSRGNKPMPVEDLSQAINQTFTNLNRAKFPTTPHQVGMRAVTDVEKGNPSMFDVLVKLQ